MSQSQRSDMPLTTMVYLECTYVPGSIMGWYPPALFHLDRACSSLFSNKNERYMLEEVYEKIELFAAKQYNSRIFLCPQCEYSHSYRSTHHAIA